MEYAHIQYMSRLECGMQMYPEKSPWVVSSIAEYSVHELYFNAPATVKI